MFTGGTDGLSVFLLLIALGLFIFRKVNERRSDQSYSEQKITVRRLLQNRRFTVYAVNPALASSYDDAVRDQLTRLKNLISASADIRAKETFEL